MTNEPENSPSEQQIQIDHDADPTLPPAYCIRWGQGSDAGGEVHYNVPDVVQKFADLLVENEPRIEVTIIIRK